MTVTLQIFVTMFNDDGHGYNDDDTPRQNVENEQKKLTCNLHTAKEGDEEMQQIIPHIIVRDSYLFVVSSHRF